jgi:hypothetical protein
MSRLEQATHLALIAVCCIAGYTLIRQHIARNPTVPSVHEGERVAVAGYDWSQTNATALLAISPRCHFCEESLPLYRTLGRVARRAKGSFRVIAVSKEPGETLAKYLEQHGVNLQGVFTSSLSKLGVRGTPTVLVVDRNGVVQSVFVGKLDNGREGQLMSRVALLCPECAR